ERAAWLRQMRATLDASNLESSAKHALWDFFERSSAYIIGRDSAEPHDPELASHWNDQRRLDDTVAAIAAAHDREALRLAPLFRDRPSVFVGLLARMIASGRSGLVE